MRATWACLLLLLAAIEGSAAEKQYAVEVVVFARTDVAAAGGGERWPGRIFAPRFERAVAPPGAAATGGAGPAADDRIHSAEARLEDTVARLRRAGDYRVLRHLSWRQPGFAREASVPLRLTAGERLTIDTPRRALRRPVPSAGNRPGGADEGGASDGEGDAVLDTADRPGSADGEPFATDTPFGAGMVTPRRQEVTVRELDGAVELGVSRYLHFHADLYYTSAVDRELITTPAPAGADSEPSAAGPQPAADDEAPADEPGIARGPDGRPVVSFALRQQRRMRSGDLHYIDHPVLGLLVLVTPVEAETGG